jgi:uncharacterized protein (TIGR02246 family)
MEADMKMRIAAVAAVVILGVSGLAAQKAEAELEKLAAHYQAVFNKGDTKALAEMYTTDALRVTPTGKLLTGRAAIEKDYVANLGGPLKGAQLTLHPGRTQMLKPDVALIEGTFDVAGGAGPMRGRYLNTVVREGGQWRLASVVTIPEMPAPSK